MTQINLDQAKLKNYMNEQLNEVRMRLDKNIYDSTDIMNKLSRFEKELNDKRFDEVTFKRDNRTCANPIVFERKETIMVKESDNFKDKTSSYLNSTYPRLSNSFDQDSKKELIVRQSTFFAIFSYLLY